MIKHYMTQFRLPLLSVVVAVVFIFNGCAMQGESIGNPDNRLDILEKRIVVLEQQELKTLADLRDEVEVFKKKVGKELENFRKSQQFFIDELNKLKEDIQIVTNENEKSQFSSRKNTTLIKKLNKRLGDQIIALQELQNFFKKDIDIKTEGSGDNVQTDFDDAFQLYKKRRFKESETAFIKFRKKYPDSEFVDDSLYFIAYMNFLQGDYNKASLRFFEIIKEYPTFNRLNDTKWWLGVSLERSGDLNGALDLYRELVKLDPNNPLRIKAQFRLDELAP